MIYVFGDCILDPQRHVLHRAGQIYPLRRKVFQVLTHLLAHPDRVVSKQELCEQVWPQQFISEGALESTIKAVRQALGDSGHRQRYIQTIYGAGYRLIVPVEARFELSPNAEDMTPPLGPPVAPALQDSTGEDYLSAPAVPTDLPYEPPTPDATPASFPGTPDAERRQLTVMLCDLRAASPLARHLDPEDLYEVIRTYQETCAGIIRHFDGYIAQYRGEGIVVYFGSPHSHDDDAQRAVQAGLRIVEAVRRLSARLARERGIRLSVRVGIHTGEVVVGTLGHGGQHALWALGETPTLATQMQRLAAPDTVVISGVTRRLIQGYFTCRELDAQTCQGVATPLQVYRIVQARGVPHRLDAATTRGLTPLVGREHEVGLLVECWGQATAGLGRIAVISGEAGIGKSRLVRVLHERLAAEPHTRIEWRCSPYDHQSPLHPVITHLQRLVRMRPADAPAELLRRLEEVLEPYGFAMAEVIPLFAALLSLPLPERYPPLMLTPQRQKHKTLEALLAWLLAETTRQPVLFIIEDLQWMDPSTLEFCSLLIDQTPTAQLLTVLTCRPEFHYPWGFRSHLTPMTLGRLSQAQATILVQRVAGKALPPEVQRHLVANTDGVPLFIEELTKTVLESGLLRTHEDRYELTGPLPTLAIPATLHDSLLARLDRLAPLKAVAQLGATIGRTFAYTVLQAVSPWNETALQHGLRQLVEAELVYQRGVPPQATYRFKHALIQETAYQSLLKSTRQQYHQQIAQVLQARFPETAEAQPELLAYHYTEADLGEQAVRYWQQAGQQAIQRSAYVETIQHLTTALALLATFPETSERVQQELALQLALGGALQATHGLAAPEVERAYARARALCAQVGDTPQLVPVLRGLSRFYSNRGALSTERELGKQLLRLTRHAPVPTHRLAAHDILGHALYHLGDYQAARAHCAQGMALIDPASLRGQALQGHAAPEVTCLTFAACTLWCLGFPGQAAGRMQEALALAQAIAHPQSLAIAHYYIAYLHQRCREAPAAQGWAEALLTLSTAQGLPFFVGLGTFFRGWALARQGQHEVGLVQMRQGMGDVWATGARLSQPLCLTLLAEATGQAGHINEGLHLLDEALEAYAASERGDMLTEVYRLQGQLLLHQTVPAVAQAEACFQQALAIARRQQAKSWELRAAMSLSRLWQHQGKRVEAYELLAPIYSWFTEGFDTADLQEAKALLEELAG